jgi:hypothetical protein
VTNRKQAIAIGLSEAGLSNKEAKQPHPKTNPGDYDDSAHRRSYGAVEANDKPSTGSVGGVAEHVEIGPDIHRGRVAHTFDRPSVKGAHGYGHGASERAGALRLSGDRGAHRIGKR